VIAVVPLTDDRSDAPTGSDDGSVAAFLFGRLPGSDPGAPKRNVAVLIAYLLGALVIVGQLVVAL